MLVLVVAAILTASVTAVVSTAGHADRHGLPDVAAGRLPIAAWGPVSAAVGLDASAYRTRYAAGGFVARNPRQELQLRFSSAGVNIRSGALILGMRLAGYGYGDWWHGASAVLPSAQANRVVYEHRSVAEWYANGPAGLEQGFTLRSRPAADRGGLTTLALDLSGNGRVAIAPDREALTFSHGASSLAFRGLVVTDARGRMLPAWLAVRGRDLLLQVNDAGARYPLTVDPFVQQAKLIASDGADEDFLGASVAVQGDTLVAGAPNAAVNGNSYQGAVYVFVKPPWAGWADATEKTKLITANGEANEFLGTSVAIDGDTVFAGQVGSANAPGAVDVFVEPRRGWPSASETETAQITAPKGFNGNAFGSALATQGNTLFVGASAGAPNGAGAVYVFQRPWSGGWQDATETAELTGAPGDCLGDALAVQFNTLLAGASCATVGGEQLAGAAYVFTKPPWADWRSATQTATLTEPTPAAFDTFGSSVAIGDDTFAIGDPFAGGENGAVYLYTEARDGSAVTTAPTATLTTPDVPDGGLGSAVAFQGDTVVAGAPFVTLPNLPGIVFEGTVFLFDKPPGGWRTETETASLLGSDIDDVGWLGYSLSVAHNTIVAGAPLSTDGNHPVQGAAYVFASGPAGFAARARGASRTVQTRALVERIAAYRELRRRRP